MKIRFALAYFFAIMLTGGLVQATPPLTGKTPTLSKVYGDFFQQGVAPMPLLGNVGAFDLTFGDSDSGIAGLSSIGTSAIAYAVQTLSDGTYVVLLGDATNSYLAKYTETGILDINFGPSSSGYRTLSNLQITTTSSIIVDEQGRFIVCGSVDTGHSNKPWIARVTAAGDVDGSFNWSTNGSVWTHINAISQQSSGKIIAIGEHGTAQIARYNLDGSLDTSFGASGFINFTGTGSPTLPSSTQTNGLTSVIVDANNNMYIVYMDGSSNAKLARFTINGSIDTTFNSTGIVSLSVLNNPHYSTTTTLYELSSAFDVNNNIIIAGRVGTNIIVTGVTSSGAAISSFVNFNSSTNGTFTTYGINGHVFDVFNLMTTSNNKIYVIGSDASAEKMMVVRLTGLGAVDSAFNPSGSHPGVQAFVIGSLSSNSQLLDASVSPDGRLYTAGYQGTTNVPYVSRFYNDLYVGANLEYPSGSEQGTLDNSFGFNESETYAGVVSPFNGLYGANLRQKAKTILELESSGLSGKLLIGMDGFTNKSATNTMMLARMTSSGILDNSFGVGGFVTLQNTTSSAEQLNALAEDLLSGAIYVAGSCATGATLRKYTSSGGSSGNGIATWAALENGLATYNAVGVQFQFYGLTSRVLLFIDEGNGHGHISAYTTAGSGSAGVLDTTFGASGKIAYNAYGLNMGPMYGTIVNSTGDIVVAYANPTTGYVDVAAIKKDGSGLVTQFANNGIFSNVFNLSGAAVTPSCVNLALDFNENVIVTTVDPLEYIHVARLDSSTGNLDTNFNGTGLLTFFLTHYSDVVISRITGVSDNSLLLTMYDIAPDNTMLVARITANGALDTTFNSQGDQPGILPIQIQNKVANYARVATGLIVQSATGNLVLSGYEQPSGSSAAVPMVMRLFGQSGTVEVKDYPMRNEVGTLDLDFGTNGAYDLHTLFGLSANAQANVVYAYPSGNTYEGMMLIGIDNGTTTKIARVDASDMTLDLSFGTAGIYTVSPSLRGIASLNIDKNNNVIIGGTNSGSGWAQQLSPNGTSSISFTVPARIIAINQIYQQKSGRYIIAGELYDSTSTNNFNVVFACQDELAGSASKLAIDRSFNPLAAGNAGNPGFYLFKKNVGVFNLAINSDDTILVAYKNTTPKLEIAKLKADGSGYVQSFNSGAVVVVNIVPDSEAVVRLALDNLGRIVVAASVGGNSVKAARLSSAGVLDTTFGTSGIKTVSNVGSGAVLTDLMETVTNQTILIGYNTSGANGKLFAVRLDSTGALDASWNTSPTSPDTAGVLTSNIDSITQANSATISISGSIYVAGQTATDPLLVKIFGDNYVAAVVEQPFEVAAGIIDTTLDIITPGSGSLNLNSAVSMTGSAKKIFINSNDNTILMASSNGTNVYLTKLNPDLSLAGAAGTPTFGTSGLVTISGKANVTDLYVADDASDNGSIYVTGYISGATSTMWAAKISADGLTVTPLTVPSVVNGTTLMKGYAIRQSTNSRILVGGVTTTTGVIAAFKSDLSGMDLSFGNGAGTGYYRTGVNSPILDMVVDSLNRIYIAYYDGSSNILVQRLLANGTGVDTHFGSGTISISPVNSVTAATQVRLKLDPTHQKLVVAFQDGTSTGNRINVHRYSTANATDGAAHGSVTSGLKVVSDTVNLSDLFIDAQQNIYVIGYTAANLGLVARIDSTNATHIALDATYGASGIAAVNTGSMLVTNAGALDFDRRVYLVGDNGSNTPYMARVFGDVYTSEVDPAIFKATLGTIDLTLDGDDATPVGAIIVSGLSGFTAQAVYTFQSGANDGKSLIAFGDGTNVCVGQFDADMNLDTANFNSAGTNAGLTELQAMTAVHSLTLDAYSNVIVAGTNSGAQQIIEYSPNGAIITDFSSLLTLTVGTQVAQQKSGRFIVGSAIGGAGTINAYQHELVSPATTITDDQTFGPFGSNGFWTVTQTATQVDGLVIDNHDYIYAVYQQSISPHHLFIEKIAANGSGLVYGFNGAGTGTGVGAAIDTGFISTGKGCIAIDNTGTNILVGTTTSAGVFVQVYACATGARVGSSLSITPTDSSAMLTALTGSGTDFVGSITSTTGSNTISAFRVLGSGAVDTTFVASTGVASFTTASFSPLAPTTMNAVAIQPDGRIVMVGGNGSSPAVIRVYGYPYAGLQDAQAPDLAEAGTLDATLPGTSYELNQTANSTFNSLIANYTVKCVYETDNGVMTFVADSGNNTTIFRLNKDLTLDTTFNSVGYRTLSSTYGNTASMYVNSNGIILLSGNYSGASWVVGLTHTGANSGLGLHYQQSMASASILLEQSSYRYILAGQGNTSLGQPTNHGFLQGIISGGRHSGANDDTFGDSGYVDSGLSAPIASFFVNHFDEFTMVSVVSGSTVMQSLDASGLTLTTLTGTAIHSVTGNQAKIIYDEAGNIILAAATSSGFEIARYHADGTDYGSHITITATSAHLGDIYATSDGKVTLVGNDGSGHVIVARINSVVGMSTTFQLDPVFNNGAIFLGTMGSLTTVYDGTIHADDRIMVVGTDGSHPYMGRLFGDDYVTYLPQGPAEGIYGTLDPTWGAAGLLNISSLGTGSSLDGQGKAIVALEEGGTYLSIDNGTNSLLIRTLVSGALDTTFNPTAVINAAGVAQTDAPSGVYSIMIDGLSRVVMVGTNTTAANYGWVQRYAPDNSGLTDTSFGSAGLVNLSTVFNNTATVATYAVEQTMGRIVVAGQNNAGDGVLFALTNKGALDVTFNSTGSLGHGGTIPGIFNTGIMTTIYGLVADEFDRLIIAYKNGTEVNVARLTASGELDTTFGTSNSGILTGLFSPNVDLVSSVALALDVYGNIVVAAHVTVSTVQKIAVTAFDNGIAVSGNGAVVESLLNITGLTAPRLTSIAARIDGSMLLAGNESGTAGAWVAQVVDNGSGAYILDTTFNPHALPPAGGSGQIGIFKYHDATDSATADIYAQVASGQDGRPLFIGTEVIAAVNTPVVLRVYDAPYISQQEQAPDSQIIGTNDFTLGFDATESINGVTGISNGINFYALAGGVSAGQAVKALALQDDNNFVTALDGKSSCSGDNKIFLNMFDIDGLLNTAFGTTGKVQVAHNYIGADEYVNDMVTFTTAAGVHKAILAGYVVNSALSVNNSSIMQYDLTNQVLDTSFGGFDGNPSGIAFGDAQQANVVGLQTSSRVIVGGIDQAGNGLLLGYTSAGKLDMSFAQGGYLQQGTTGIYTHAIDSYDRIVIAYNDGSNNIAVARFLADGSALDPNFGTGGFVTTTISNAVDNSNIRVAIDSSNNVIVAAVTNTSSVANVTLHGYSSTGALLVATTVFDATLLGSYTTSVYRLTNLMVDINGKVIFVVTDSSPIPNTITVVRAVVSSDSYILDATFNPYDVVLNIDGTPGYLMYQIGGTDTQVVNDAMIHPDGRIFVGGSEN